MVTRSVDESGRRPPAAAGLRCLALTAALLLAGPAMGQASVLGPVQVRFAGPLGHAGAGDDPGPGQSLRGTLRELAQILEDLGRTRLRPGERLDLTVLDLNRAGLRSVGHGVAEGPRVLTGATAPGIRLAYVLRRDGRVVARGEEYVTDLNYLVTQNPRFSSGPLYYERRILRDWFDDRFRYGLGRG